MSDQHVVQHQDVAGLPGKRDRFLLVCLPQFLGYRVFDRRPVTVESVKGELMLLKLF